MSANGKNKSPEERKRLRKFGITLGILLGIVGGIFWWRGSDVYQYFFGLGAILIALAFTAPSVMHYIEIWWLAFGEVLNWVMTRVILGIIFYTIFTAIGLIWRIVNKDPLGLRFDRNSQSYWIPKKDVNSDTMRYERQF